jgi:hypothetical protein
MFWMMNQVLIHVALMIFFDLDTWDKRNKKFGLAV